MKKPLLLFFIIYLASFTANAQTKGNIDFDPDEVSSCKTQAFIASHSTINNQIGQMQLNIENSRSSALSIVVGGCVAIISEDGEDGLQYTLKSNGLTLYFGNARHDGTRKQFFQQATTIRNELSVALKNALLNCGCTKL